MISAMFSYEGKLSHLVPKSQLKAYANLHKFLKKKQATHEIPVHPTDYLGGNELATSIGRWHFTGICTTGFLFPVAV